MKSQVKVFDNINRFVERTNKLLSQILFESSTFEKFEIIVNDYFYLFNDRLSIIKGFVVASKSEPLFFSKYQFLCSLRKEFELVLSRVKSHEVIDNDEKFLASSKRMVVENRILPLLDFVINEFEIFLNDKELLLKDENRIKPLKWKGTQVQLIELIKSLIEVDVIGGVQTDIINEFSKFLSYPINNEDKVIQDIKKRNNGSETLFLDKLKKGLYDHIQNKNKR